MEIKGDSQYTFNNLCSTLEYNKKNGLVESDSETEDNYQKHVYIQSKEKLGIDAIFFIKSEAGSSFPIIYFYKLKSYNLDKIAEIHKKAWNMGQAPLIFIVLPDVVLIYSAYEKPEISDGKLDPKAGFIEELKLFISSDREINKIKNYRSSELLTGTYWQKYSKHFKNKNRVYQVLLDNLAVMRKRLIDDGLPSDIVHKLLTRSIFIKYLEDRKDKNGHSAFPKGFFGNYLDGAKHFTDILSDKDATEKLFNDLNKKFNGDIFDISENKSSISQNHLDLLQKMLTGNVYLENGQMSLWPLYSFDIIPIELISNIYQKFVSHESVENETINNGSHYTPYHLVTFLLDQVLPWEEDKINVKILDPSCGSGIFLVEAYRRLVSRWIRLNQEKRLSIIDLKSILTENIFGVDVNSNAIRIAALSLYLTMCDYFEPRYIWNQVKFEPLINRNLFENDFFEETALFLEKKYDLIIGNPPWESKLSKSINKYLNENNKTVGDKQISQAFLWRVAELCKPEGEICMLVSSKSLLFNRSKPNKEFRKQFISSFDVKTIINFSALRHILFSEAIGPPTAVIFSPKKTCYQSILYCSPKPSYSTQDDWLFIIEPQDIAQISTAEAIENDLIWKIAMWGSPRDYDIIKKLSKLPTLEDICIEKKWIHSEGYIEGGKNCKKTEVPELLGIPNVDSKNDLKRYTIEMDSLKPFMKKELYRSSKTKREIFKGPHILIRQSPKAGLGMVAALLLDDAIFNHSILGIHGNENDLDQLAACCLIINTNIVLYYEMLTSRSWLVERDYFEKEELLTIPIPESILSSKEFNYRLLKKIASDPEADNIINKMATKLYNLTEDEVLQINDTVQIRLDYFRKKDKSFAINPPTVNWLEEYITTFCKTLNKSFSSPNKIFVGRIYTGDGPLKVVSASLVEKLAQPTYSNSFDNELDSILDELNKSLTEEISQSVYVRRNLRRYSGDSIFIVKPNQTRFWTKSAALRDADETYRDIMSASEGFN